MPAEFFVGGDTLKGPVRFLFAGDDFHFQTGSALDGVEEGACVLRVAGGAGSDDADGFRLPAARGGSELGDDLRRLGDRFALQAMRFVKALTQPGLLAV